MQLRGITVVILMVGIMGVASILGMVLIAVVHDGDLSTGVISNLEAIAVGAVTATGTLIAHYIGAGTATQQLQTQATAAATTPTVTVPVALTPVASVAAAESDATGSGV